MASSFIWKEDFIYTSYTCIECEEFLNLPENHDAVQECYQNECCTEGWIFEFDDYKDFLNKKLWKKSA